MGVGKTEQEPLAQSASGFSMSGSRTRVTIFLPVQSDRDVHAAMACLRYLQAQRSSDPQIGGYTASRLHPSSFVGAWYDAEGNRRKKIPPGWCEEAVIQVVKSASQSYFHPLRC